MFSMKPDDEMLGSKTNFTKQLLVDGCVIVDCSHQLYDALLRAYPVLSLLSMQHSKSGVYLLTLPDSVRLQKTRAADELPPPSVPIIQYSIGILSCLYT